MVDGRRRLPSRTSSSSLSLSSLYRINVFILLVRFSTTKLHLIIILQETREGGRTAFSFFPVWGVCVCMMRHLLTSSSSKPPLPPRVNVDSIYSRSGYRYSLDSISCMTFFFFLYLFFSFFLPPATAPTNARRVFITVATGIVSSCPHQLCEPSRRGAHGSMLW